MTKKIKPLADRVLIKRVAPEERSKGGLIIPEAAQEKSLQAEVYAVGPQASDFLKKGDKVLLNKYAGNELKYDGEDLLILKLEDIMAVIE